MSNRTSSARISELMTLPATLRPIEPVSRAMELLQRPKAYEVFIADENEVLGVVTIRDILKAGDIARTKICSLMSRVPKLDAEDSVDAAAKIMTDHRVRAVPIVENDRLVGQLTA